MIMKDFAVIVTFEDGSKKVNGYYKSKNRAINVAKTNNECKYLYNDYSVMQISTREIIYKK